MTRQVFFVAMLALIGVGTTVPAWAAKVGDNLYVKAKNTKMMDSTAPTAGVIAVLQPGEAVVWKGSDPSNRRWHKALAGGRNGVIFQSNLSANKPQMEMVAGSGGKVDPKAFASSGAATKALGEGAKKYGESQDMGASVKQFETLERLSKQVGTPQVAAHVKKSKLFPVVGAEE